MPVPAPNLYPPFNIVRLSHVEYRVRDLAKSRAFYVDTLGLQVTHEDADRIYLRALEERGHHCIVLVRADASDVGFLGFKLYDEPDLDQAAAWFADKGLPVEWVERPHMGRTLRTRDPWGIPLEFYVKMERLAPIHQKYKLYRGVRPLRIDHFNMFSADVDASVAFYNEMGFRTTEYTEDSESGKVWAAWMHRKGGVHDVAFTNGFGPRLHHTAFWVPTPMAIIDLLDLMATTGWVDNIERGPGRHGISNAFFLYVLDPRRAPDRNLLFGLPDGRSRSGTDQMGTSKTPSARRSGAPPRRGRGSNMDHCSKGPSHRRPRSRRSRSLRRERWILSIFGKMKQGCWT